VPMSLSRIAGSEVVGDKTLRSSVTAPTASELPMSSTFARVGLLGGLAVVLSGVIAGAQDRTAVEPGGQQVLIVFNSVEGRTTVVTIEPDGTRVEKGELVCELDPSPLRDRLAVQEIVVQGVDTDVQATRIAREVAVMNLNEYKNGLFIQELARTEGEIKLAEAKLAGAEDQMAWSERMYAKGYISKIELTKDQLALKHARFAVEGAQSKRTVLIDHSKPRKLKELLGKVEAARACELVKQAAAERERVALKRIREQIGRCKLTAPGKGRIQYANPIGPGAVVHDGQLICHVVADGPAITTKAK
jgi:multidrug resistance efflux pump